jgi:hypothetical protein
MRHPKGKGGAIKQRLRQQKIERGRNQISRRHNGLTAAAPGKIKGSAGH